MGKEARSLGNLFMFRESEKRLKETPGGSFFVYPYQSEKEIISNNNPLQGDKLHLSHLNVQVLDDSKLKCLLGIYRRLGGIMA